MKTNRHRHSTLALLAGGALLVSMVLPAARGGEVVINNFDDPSEATQWSWESWSSPADVAFDTANAGGGAAGSGSLRVSNNFTNYPTGYSQAVVSESLGGNVDAETLYTNISLDIKLDPSSFPRVDGTNYGYFEVIFRNGSSWDWNSLGGVELTSAYTNWTHLVFAIKAPADQVHHLTFKLGENNLTNTVIYNVDNIRWTEAPVALPPPAMTIEKTKLGLNLLAASGGQYDRQNLVTVADTFSWVGSNAPMSYSMTIKEFPDGTAHPGFSAHFYLVPGTPGSEEYPDWTEPTCALISIHADTNNAGICEFHYKTNAPNSNGINNQYFNDNPTNGPVGFLGSVSGASILGTWTVTFNQDTNITLTAPDGTTNNLVMPPEDAAQFAGSGTVYFGIMTGELPNVGQMAVLSRAQIKAGPTTLLDDNFSVSPLDPNVWVVRAASAAGVTLITPDEPFYVSWTTPASGFTLQTNATFNDADWADPGLTSALVGARYRVLVPASVLPSTGQGFFRLIKTQ